MTSSFERVVQISKQKKDDGASHSDVLLFLRSEGLLIIDAIKATREIYNISLAEAKEICASSDYWREQVENTKPLHNEIERIFR